MHLPPPEPEENELYMQTRRAYALAHPDPFADMTGSNVQQSVEVAVSHSQSQVSDTLSLDTRRLQAQHTTEGYRDGITAGKAESIQPGFDEGFRVGAEIGLKVGQLLGLLEGLAAALGENGSGGSAHIGQLLSEATEELGIQSIFAEKYWESDGSCRYTVRGSSSDSGVMLKDIASEHPIIRKWDELINQQVQRWKIC